MSKNVGRSSGGKSSGTGGSVRRTSTKSGKTYKSKGGKIAPHRGGGASGGGGTSGFKE